ncbi:cobalt ECF transporter T component CbiQ [Desulfurispora thermophila]|uniref:cobalt ECF transporter T component CbiQ n=1 Tax=Desulfurispora thermophila TaxID=265470 RepID=UPI000371EE7A|nr:cobalt ECF transporter T component CbiQ [Desulfurispora thermophila]
MCMAHQQGVMDIGNDSGRRNWLGGIDPRMKILVLVSYVVIVTTLSSPVLLLVAGGFMLVVNLLAGIKAKDLLLRLAWVIPFTLVMLLLFPFITPGEQLWVWDWKVFIIAASRQGMEKAWILSGRVVNAFLAMNMLLLTTGWSQLFAGFRALKLPVLLLQIIEFAVRYIYVLQAELKSMRTARLARNFRPGKVFWHRHTMSTLSADLGTLFLRSWERSERVYTAMLARGFGQPVRVLDERTLIWHDLAFATGIMMVALCLFWLDNSAAGWVALFK